MHRGVCAAGDTAVGMAVPSGGQAGGEGDVPTSHQEHSSLSFSCPIPTKSPGAWQGLKSVPGLLWVGAKGGDACAALTM